MGRNKYRGGDLRPFKPGFNPRPQKEDLLFTGDNAMGTIPNCLMLNHNNIRFIAPSPASTLFEQAIASVDQEELKLLVFPDKDGTAKFKVTKAGSIH